MNPPLKADFPDCPSVVVVGGLAIAKVGYDKYLRFVWPLLVGMLVVSGAVIAIAAVAG